MPIPSIGHALLILYCTSILDRLEGCYECMQNGIGTVENALKCVQKTKSPLLESIIILDLDILTYFDRTVSQILRINNALLYP